MRRHLVLLLPLTILWGQPVHAWTVAEIRAMPPYCAGRYAKNDNLQEYKRWEAMYGPDFLHTHHLCDGIGALNKVYKAKSPMERQGILNEAMGGLNYMVRNAQPSFKLMPEVYIYRSQANYLMDRPGEAVADLRKAIELDPKASRAYSQAADYLERRGQRDEALKLVSEGLRHLPSSGSLQRLYTKLGGKLPYPEPYQQPAETETAQEGPEAVQNKAAVGSGPADQTPTEVQAAGKTASRENAASRNLAIFDFSRNVGAARRDAPIVGAGAHVVVEVTEHPSARNKVLFKIKSRIPQPVARIPSVAIDTGSFTDLITSVEVYEVLYKNSYKMTSPMPHAYWPGFTPDFMVAFSAIDGKLYDPRALSPGSYLTLSATLGPGKVFDDVVQAMKAGLASASGLRFGIIGHHLMGRRPDPTKTIMDDAGFLTGSLRTLSGPNVKEDAADRVGQEGQKGLSSQEGADHADAGTPASRENPPQVEAGGKTSPAASSTGTTSIGTPTNPWCRFCPEQQ